MVSSRFDEFLKGVASVHGSKDGVRFSSKDFPPLNSKSPLAGPSSLLTNSPPSASQLKSGASKLDDSTSRLADSDPVDAHVHLHADPKHDSYDGGMKSSRISLFQSREAAQLRFQLLLMVSILCLSLNQ